MLIDKGNNATCVQQTTYWITMNILLVIPQCQSTSQGSRPGPL